MASWKRRGIKTVLNLRGGCDASFYALEQAACERLGLKLVDSIFRRDYLVVQGFVLVIAAFYVIVNFLVDLLYSVLDPRTRYATPTR